MSSTIQDQGAADELDWLAFRYVAGELAPAEREVFELRLDQEQRAREAVAAATYWQSLLQAALLRAAIVAPSPRPRTSPHFKVLQRLALLAASCGAVAYLGSEQGDSHSPATAVAARDELAAAWAGVVAVNDAPVLRDAEMNVTENNSAENVPSAEQIDGDPLAAPLWMLAALDANSADASGNDEEFELDASGDGMSAPAMSTEATPDAETPENHGGGHRPEGSGAGLPATRNWAQS
jgi:hypothetical protein